MSRSLTASDRSSLIRLASSLPAGSAERKAILAGLAGMKASPKTAKVYVSPKVEVTPAMQEAMAAFERLWDYGGRLEERGGAVHLSTYREGYIPVKIPAQYSSYSSVGGDYEVGYQKTAPQTKELRTMVSLDVSFFPDGKVKVELSEPKYPVSGSSGWANSEEKILSQGRGFGPARKRALAIAKMRFEHWVAQFV
jgi:hypothetical protein